MSDVRILNYGDSQGEVLDYVFHGDANYVAREADDRVGWHSGWSTRGLAKPENRARILEPAADSLGLTDGVPAAHTVVFLSFGSVDIEWNLAFKRDVLGETPDEAKFVGEMISELRDVVRDLAALGETARARHAASGAAGAAPALHVVLCFPFAPLPLAEDYVRGFNARHGDTVSPNYRVAPRAERLAMWSAFIDGLAARFAAEPALAAVTARGRNVVDVREDFAASPDARAFTRDDGIEDHHPDYTKTQHVVAARVAALALGGGAAPLVLRPTPTITTLLPHVRRPLPKPKKARAAAKPAATPPRPRRAVGPIESRSALSEIVASRLNSPAALARPSPKAGAAMAFALGSPTPKMAPLPASPRAADGRMERPTASPAVAC